MGTAVNFLAGCMAGGVLAICGDGGDIGERPPHAAGTSSPARNCWGWNVSTEEYTPEALDVVLLRICRVIGELGGVPLHQAICRPRGMVTAAVRRGIALGVLYRIGKTGAGVTGAGMTGARATTCTN